MRTIELHIDNTFARTEQEAKDKLKSISNYPEIKERLHEIEVRPSSIGLAYKGGVSCVLPRKRSGELTQTIDGFSAYLMESE
jgi:repressor of nif and glnA expression